MSRRVVLLFTVLVLSYLPAVADAAGGNTDSGSGTSAGSDSPFGVISVGASQPGSGGSSSSGNGPVCTWQVVTVGQVATLGEISGELVLSADPSAPLRRLVNGTEQTAYFVQCGDKAPQFRWIDTETTSKDLVPGLRDSMSKTLPLPTPNLSPIDSGVVNLGMWLAVEPIEPVSLSAEAGTAWITMRASHLSTTFAFGNGDSVTCEGFGTPIVDVDTVDEGPCGYTYRHASPPDEPYRLTVSTTWGLSYTSSDGPGSLPALTRSTTIDYPVREIQTIGVQG